MTLIADILLVAGALGAMIYCMVLSRRLNRLNDLEKGVGGAVAILAVQVDDMTKTLKQTHAAAHNSTSTLEGLTNKAEDVSKRLELMVAAMHDLPETTISSEGCNSEAKPETVFLRHQEQNMEAAE